MKMRKWGIALLILVIVAVLSLYPLDMYISRPGSAYDLTPLVEVVGGDTEDEGTFSLMTIAIGKATPLTYAYSNFTDTMNLLPAAKVRMHGESDAEYGLRQKKLMTDSKTHAISVAFDRAGLPIDRNFTGIFVAGVLPAGASAGKLQVGDVIQSIDQQELASLKEFMEEISGKPEGQKVNLQITRGKKDLDVSVDIKELPGTEGRMGIGIQPEEQIALKTDPKVNIKTEQIGGPSAGLMFTLELMNRLLDVDLTKGYDIAGTGEMLEDGSVGRIGGIDFKIIAAHRQGIEIFFAPDDKIPAEIKKKNPQLLSNYEEAKATADKIGTKMKVVPVKTIDDALVYLEKLEKK